MATMQELSGDDSAMEWLECWRVDKERNVLIASGKGYDTENSSFLVASRGNGHVRDDKQANEYELDLAPIDDKDRSQAMEAAFDSILRIGRQPWASAEMIAEMALFISIRIKTRWRDRVN